MTGGNRGTSGSGPGRCCMVHRLCFERGSDHQQAHHQYYSHAVESSTVLNSCPLAPMLTKSMGCLERVVGMPRTGNRIILFQWRIGTASPFMHGHLPSWCGTRVPCSSLRGRGAGPRSLPRRCRPEGTYSKGGGLVSVLDTTPEHKEMKVAQLTGTAPVHQIGQLLQ